MLYLRKIWLMLPLFLICGCTYWQETPTYQILPYQENMIVLQNLKTRVLVYCYTIEDQTAESCAEKFENGGFVRLKDIPRLTADYDTLKSDTYPTRRWRKEDKVPRW